MAMEGHNRKVCFMGKADAAIETVKQIIRTHFGCDTDEIGKIRNITNNSVYFFTIAGKRYYLKLYRSKNWPEKGKVPFVYQRLSQNHIRSAELIAYNRDNEMYPNGYLIECEIQGTAADKILLDREQEIGLYIKLAELMSSVHSIRIPNYGYIGSGIASHNSMIDFLEDEFDGIDDSLEGIVPEKQLKKMKAKVLDTMHNYEDLPSVLCHGDLSKKNVIICDDGEISLIDWDDAMALNWMADVSRLTFWMKQNYNNQEYSLFRNVFLDHYGATHRKAQFDAFESAYHIYTTLDFLIFSIRVGDTETENRLKSCLDSFNTL